MSFSKRSGSDVVCYTKPLDSLKIETIVSFGLTLLLVPHPFLGIPAKTADPTKVRVAERQRTENEPRFLKSTVGHVVPLISIAPACASSELKASDVAPLQSRRQRKRKTVVADASGPSHPPKKLKEDYGALGEAFTAGKSRFAVQSLFTGAVLNAEARGEPIPTLAFVTSSVSATPEREEKSLDDSVTGLNLRTIGAPQRFVISSDSSHHFGANIAEAEVDSIVGSSAPAIATVTTVTVVVDADATTDREPVVPSLFGVGSSSSGRTDSVPGGFSNVFGSDFLIGGIRTVVDPDSDLQKVYISLSAEGEVGVLIDHNATLEREKNDLSMKVTDLSASVKVREQEVADLDALVTAIKLQNDNLVDQVHELEISSVGLQEKVAAKAVEKGMHEGLSTGITHGAEGRTLADVVAYNPSAETDYLSALQRLQNDNFSLIMELKSNKDASVDTIINLLHLDDALAERLGSTESQPHANQLMVPIHHSPDQRVVGASALSLSLDFSHSWVRKIRENIASHVSALRGVFVLLSEPLSAAALEGTEGTSSSAHDTTTTLSATFVSAGTIPPIFTDDYEVAHADGQGCAGVDDETAAVGNINLFSDVSNAELNILE
uniref:Transposase (Putative), gypsy type n=1 Tax=Tanacetum cinerariifolium TaxID=118510 RepID=A0A6L2NC05_TANCI|nr:hypothetical protein [Tanacetum cinerariifolium]